MGDSAQGGNPSVLFVLFSYDRAMQTDAVLRSIEAHLQVPELQVSVLWRASTAHRHAYELLQDLHPGPKISFVQERSPSRGEGALSSRLRRPRNLARWLKYPHLHHWAGFALVLEDLLSETESELVAFGTDDAPFYRGEQLPDQAVSALRADPFQVSYRTYVGGNQTKCPSTVARSGDCMVWSYYGSGVHTHWAYPFSVSGTFYSRSAVLQIMREVLYHNPVTLEANVVDLVRRRQLFGRGYSPLHSSMVIVPLNKVDFGVPANQRGDCDPETLNRYFLDGYRLERQVPEPVDRVAVLPEHIRLVSEDDVVLLPVRREV